MKQRILIAALIAAATMSLTGAARAQSNFAFIMGGTGVFIGDEDISWGTSVGAIGKFNVAEYLLLRLQFNVDRAYMRDVQLPDFNKSQTVTFVCVGPGVEVGVGTRDVNFMAHLTVHGGIRTISRIITDDQGREQVWALNRFSLGMIMGMGLEAYISDNIGFELQGQYDIFNFDHTPVDPIYRGMRGTVGVQFYLGRNFAR